MDILHVNLPDTESIKPCPGVTVCLYNWCCDCPSHGMFASLTFIAVMLGQYLHSPA